MDISQSIAPNSDQANADDFLGGPRTFTIDKVTAGTPEQPVDVHLVELPGRPYKPSKSMRRVMVQAWGADSKTYTGRSLTLYRNPDIRFGKDLVGGIEISAMSHLAKRLTVPLTTSRGKRKAFTVEPLEAATKTPLPARDWAAEAEATGGDLDKLRALWKQAEAAGASKETLQAIQNTTKGTK